jgi:hypothetical protein
MSFVVSRRDGETFAFLFLFFHCFSMFHYLRIVNYIVTLRLIWTG